MLNEKVYLNSSLPFGASSSCAIFERVSTALQWIITHHTQISWISYFLDDFPLLESSQAKLLEFMSKFHQILNDIGMPIVTNKTLGPTILLEYLGLLLDFHKQLILIPEAKRVKCLKLIESFLQSHAKKNKVMVKTVQKLAGSLNFICQALPVGRPFLASLYRMTRSKTGSKLKIGHHRRISNKTSNDLQMFRSFIVSNANISVQSVPFLCRLEIYSDDIELFADAAGSADKGLGCVFKNKWFYGAWEDTNLFHANLKLNIALLELLAIVTAFDLWASQLQTKTIVLRSDNMATCCFINRKKADIPAVMTLLHHLTLACLKFQIYVKAKHIPGSTNTSADLISRNRIKEFLQQNPSASKTPCQPPQLGLRLGQPKT